jgi:hypothetical protein
MGAAGAAGAPGPSGSDPAVVVPATPTKQ